MVLSGWSASVILSSGFGILRERLLGSVRFGKFGLGGVALCDLAKVVSYQSAVECGVGINILNMNTVLS